MCHRFYDVHVVVVVNIINFSHFEGAFDQIIFFIFNQIPTIQSVLLDYVDNKTFYCISAKFQFLPFYKVPKMK